MKVIFTGRHVEVSDSLRSLRPGALEQDDDVPGRHYRRSRHLQRGESTATRRRSPSRPGAAISSPAPKPATCIPACPRPWTSSRPRPTSRRASARPVSRPRRPWRRRARRNRNWKPRWKKGDLSAQRGTGTGERSPVLSCTVGGSCGFQPSSGRSVGLGTCLWADVCLGVGTRGTFQTDRVKVCPVRRWLPRIPGRRASGRSSCRADA